MKKWTKKQWVLYWLFTLLLFILWVFYMSCYKKKEQEKTAFIERNGIETIGTIYNRGRAARAQGYYIHFYFKHDNQLIYKYQNLYNYLYLYEHAIIGMKYKVKYLPESPKRDAVIYIEEPIPSEYINIEKERERIFNHNGASKRNARKMEDIQYLIPIEYRD